MPQQFLDLFLQLIELFHFARLGELRQLFQVDDADLSVFAGLFQLLEQPIDRLQFLFDFQGVRNVEPCAACERVLAGQLVDLILVAQPCHELHQLPGEWRPLVARLMPEPFQLANLLVVKALLKAFPQIARWLHRRALLSIRLFGVLEHLARFVFRQDLPLPLQQHGLQSLDTRPQSGDLAGVQMNRAGQLFLGQLAHAAVHQQMLERRRNQVGWRRSRAGKVVGVELLVSVNHAAKTFVLVHALVPSGLRLLSLSHQGRGNPAAYLIS